MKQRSLLDRLKAKVGRIHAVRLTRRFLKAAETATATQDKLLAEMIAQGVDSDFGREHHFGRIRHAADFKANVPIRNYEDFAPYLDRVRRGDVSALFRPSEKILMFALTSGTTAEPKYIPITQHVLADSRRGWNVWGVKALLDHHGCFLRHIVQVTSPMNDHSAPSGVPCGAITGLLAATQKKVVLRYYTSPLAVSRIRDSRSKYYTIMRLAIPRDVAWAVTANPATLMLLARTADDHREQMIRDIHDGTLWDEMAVDGDIRTALSSRLAPDPICARRLEQIVSKNGAMYPKHYWNLGYLAHWTGGTMGLYRSQFPLYFGDTPSRDIGLIASEGRMSIPVDDGTPAGILAVTSQFFEFIPAADYSLSKREGVATLRSHEVVEGEEYFLVLTNRSGLYRYDMGDRVRVTGWVGQAPLIEFLSRDDHTASLTGEKLTEDQVVMAMSRVLRHTGTATDVDGTSLINFVLAPRWEAVPRYRLYMESSVVRQIDKLPQRFDEALCRINVEYASKRESLRLEALELTELPDGRLTERDRRLRRQRTRTAEQFKHQYLLPRPGLDTDLEPVTLPQ
ncbi:MAG: GH3 auxin-responsive promoter family protein [Phycisphaerales bacterium]|nr:GH3 auxin-responsive promoter family protein [Phycisphaerales bacterium]